MWCETKRGADSEGFEGSQDTGEKVDFKAACSREFLRGGLTHRSKELSTGKLAETFNLLLKIDYLVRRTWKNVD